MKQEKEIKVVSLMIRLYCNHNHGTKKGELCDECKELLEYVKFRRSKCPHGDHKPFCANCPIQCYKPSMKARITKVMRYSGPRMILYHPIVATSHLIQTKQQRRKMKKQENAKHCGVEMKKDVKVNTQNNLTKQTENKTTENK